MRISLRRGEEAWASVALLWRRKKEREGIRAAYFASRRFTLISLLTLTSFPSISFPFPLPTTHSLHQVFLASSQHDRLSQSDPPRPRLARRCGSHARRERQHQGRINGIVVLWTANRLVSQRHSEEACDLIRERLTLYPCQPQYQRRRQSSPQDQVICRCVQGKCSRSMWSMGRHQARRQDDSCQSHRLDCCEYCSRDCTVLAEADDCLFPFPPAARQEEHHRRSQSI
jgi:hypothetical protein